MFGELSLYDPFLTLKWQLICIGSSRLCFQEAQALPLNDVRVVVKFLKKLFSQFGAPRAIISD